MRISKTSWAIAWGPLVIAIAANVAGYTSDLYRRFWWFDEVIHAYTIMAITLALALFLYGSVLVGARDHRLLLVLAIASLGIAIGALWEIAEWAYDQVAASDIIKGKRDTIIDLIVDSLGAVVAGILASRMVDDRRER